MQCTITTRLYIYGGNPQQKSPSHDASLSRCSSSCDFQRQPETASEQWVFGICDTSTTPGVTYMEIVPDRRAQTLIPIIERVVRHGSIIHSPHPHHENKRLFSEPTISSRKCICYVTFRDRNIMRNVQLHTHQQN